MRDPAENGRSMKERQIEQEILRGRKFNPQEALGRMAGPGAMKGGSAVSRELAAEIAVQNWLRAHLGDTVGALTVVLHRQLKGSAALLDNVDQPLVALAVFVRRVLGSDHRLREIVREADVEWGRMMDERPFFEVEGRPAHPDDPYSIDSVRAALLAIEQDLPPTG